MAVEAGTMCGVFSWSNNAETFVWLKIRFVSYYDPSSILQHTLIFSMSLVIHDSFNLTSRRMTRYACTVSVVEECITHYDRVFHGISELGISGALFLQKPREAGQIDKEWR